MSLTLEQLENIYKAKFGDIYIPENSEGYEDIYNFAKLKKEVFNRYSEEGDFKQMYPTPNDLLDQVIKVMEWEFPSTCMTDILIDIQKQS